MEDYRVQLDSYSGPMDLLLYLIRREEVDIYDIPIARILEQYLGYVRVLEDLDPDSVGDFLVLAASLMEIKSRLLLPKPPPEEGDEEMLDPRADLVRQLLAYRAFREAAHDLGQRAEQHSQRFARPWTEAPDGQVEASVDIEDAQVWDLLAAFNKLLASIGRQRTTHEVIYDDTPIALHAADILDLLQREGPSMPFERIFEGRTRAEMIGLFLALLELIRQRRVRAEQPEPFGTIIIHLLDPTPITVILEAPRVGGAEPPAEQADERAGDRDEPAPVGTLAGDDLDDEEENDEFKRQIRAIEVGEVDLGQYMDDDVPEDGTTPAAVTPEDATDAAAGDGAKDE